MGKDSNYSPSVEEEDHQRSTGRYVQGPDPVLGSKLSCVLAKAKTNVLLGNEMSSIVSKYFVSN